ncbi:MAG: DNA transformation protein [Flavobacteriaceae bacterium]|jgi:DNA transformation protein
MKSPEFKDYVVDQLLSWSDEVIGRSMFGGFGLYVSGVMFALISDDALYIKVGETNKELFKEIESYPFTYSHKNGKKVSLSYWYIPDDIIEDHSALSAFATSSLLVAQNTKK